mmetsp:Transcript_48076/g.88579  ORF Transcript_48076/g.88579 Transcript_48076/m.88579 type:complete len:647 (-) Transcript_48076:173-2113(-)
MQTRRRALRSTLLVALGLACFDWAQERFHPTCQVPPAAAPTSYGAFKLLILESHGKIHKVKAALPNDFRVEACGGHITQIALPKDIPKEIKSQNLGLSKFGVDIDNSFEPYIECIESRIPKIDKLRRMAHDAGIVYLATDPDREGEAIAWHLCRELALPPHITVHRVAFSEITPSAIQEAVRNPRKIDTALVAAQEARSILDRLAGFTSSALVSMLLKRSYSNWLSAGRVQSPALRLVCSRENDIKNFSSTKYVKLQGKFMSANHGGMEVTATYPHQAKSATLLTEQMADNLLKTMRMCTACASVKSIDITEARESPPPALDKVAMTVEAEKRLGIKPARSAEIAQKLYEKGLTTYVRTDSKQMSADGLASARASAQKDFNYAAPVVKSPATKSASPSSKGGMVQGGHEALRPTISAQTRGFAHPSTVNLPKEEAALYDLIWRRTVSSVMPIAKYSVTKIVVEVQFTGPFAQSLPKELQSLEFGLSERILVDPGFLKAYGRYPQQSQLPPLGVGDIVSLQGLQKKITKSSPPPRLTEGTLVKTLRGLGIGRPSTYESVLKTLKTRKYVNASRTLVPTDLGHDVIEVLLKEYAQLVQYNYTAEVEKGLDDIARGIATKEDILNAFYHGDPVKNTTGLKVHVEKYLGR